MSLETRDRKILLVHSHYGALAVDGVGPLALPVDWKWRTPGGGKMFSHARNDIGGMSWVNNAHAAKFGAYLVGFPPWMRNPLDASEEHA